MLLQLAIFYSKGTDEVMTGKEVAVVKENLTNDIMILFFSTTRQ